MTIDIGMECASQLDIRKSNNVAINMVIADFFIVRIFLIVQLSQVIFDE